MGRVYLPIGKKAHLPYALQPLGLDVWTIEELCHAIILAADLLEKDFVSQELVDFIRRQLGLSDLAGELSDMVAEECTLTQFCAAILDATDYVRGQERSTVIDKIERSEKSTPIEKLQKKLDRLMDEGEYFSVLSQCESILSTLQNKEEQTVEDAEMQAAVLMQQATAYAKLFYYEPASQLFFEAHQYYDRADLSVNSKRALQQYLLCLCMLWGEVRFMKFVEANPDYRELSILARRRYERAAKEVEQELPEEVIGI